MDMKDTERATLNVLFGINAFSNISSIEMLVGDCKWLEYKTFNDILHALISNDTEINIWSPS